MHGPPVILEVERIIAIVHVPVAYTLADTKVIGKTQKKVRQARPSSSRQTRVLPVESELAGESFISRVEKVVAIAVELEPGVKFMRAVTDDQRIAELDHSIGEYVGCTQVVGNRSNVAERSSQGREKGAG